MNKTNYLANLLIKLSSVVVAQPPLHRTFLMVNDQLLMINEFIIHNLQLIIKKTGEFRPLFLVYLSWRPSKFSSTQQMKMNMPNRLPRRFSTIESGAISRFSNA